MSKKILFIEDEEALQRAMRDVLSQRGHEMINASDGKSGILAAEKNLPDLILLDLVLPKKNGFEVLQALKENEKTKNIPVIILTNLEGSEDVDHALASGATTYLIKANYSAHDIVAKIEEILNHRG